ncbi:NHL repeat-containing protein 2-like isoform X2 [Lineus longissimus]
MHILPDLEALEDKFTENDGVFVVGIHSAKFDNEKLLTNIVSAVLRYGIHHPVVNDQTASLWQQLQVQCWPTLMILGPKNQILLTLMGEGNRELLIEFVGIALEYYKKTDSIRPSHLPMDLAKHHLPSSVLSFPGKVAVNEKGDWIAVSDIGHHRVLIIDKLGMVQYVIGGDRPGFKDGSFKDTKFHSPQGLAWHKDLVFLADTDNHAIRQIDLSKQEVTTLAGTGEQGHCKQGGAIGTQQPISSPWDLVMGNSLGSDVKDMMFIAMAGSHQIWMLFLNDAKWIKNSDYKKGTCINFAGSGNEENRNNSYPHRAGFAQPSGLTTACWDNINFLFVADSESSSIRTISLKDGAVKALVGGERDPTNLFASGDVDGKGYDARLQHPLGVAMAGDGTLLVADSYNHKIKQITIKTKECCTLVGHGSQGDEGGRFEDAAFDEPGGLACSPDGSTVYVADTNNHKIKVLNMQERSVSELYVLMSSKDEVSKKGVTPWKRLTPKSAKVIECDPISVQQEFEVVIKISLPVGSRLTSDAPSSWQLWMEDPSILSVLTNDTKTSGRITDLDDPPRIRFKIPDSLNNSTHDIKDIVLECMVYHCNDEGLCKMSPLVFKKPFERQIYDGSAVSTYTIEYTVQ